MRRLLIIVLMGLAGLLGHAMTSERAAAAPPLPVPAASPADGGATVATYRRHYKKRYYHRSYRPHRGFSLYLGPRLYGYRSYSYRPYVPRRHHYRHGRSYHGRGAGFVLRY